MIQNNVSAKSCTISRRAYCALQIRFKTSKCDKKKLIKAQYVSLDAIHLLSKTFLSIVTNKRVIKDGRVERHTPYNTLKIIQFLKLAKNLNFHKHTIQIHASVIQVSLVNVCKRIPAGYQVYSRRSHGTRVTKPGKLAARRIFTYPRRNACKDR